MRTLEDRILFVLCDVMIGDVYININNESLKTNESVYFKLDETSP